MPRTVPPRRLKINRSELSRTDLREHLRRTQSLERERRDRDGYARVSDRTDDLGVFQGIAVWPEDN